jgi:hypothetical protein
VEFPGSAVPRIEFRVNPKNSCGKIIDAVNKKAGPDWRLVYNVWSLGRDMSIRDLGIQDRDVILARRELRGGKPVVYLFSPSEVDASVTLSLVPDWRFTAIYPVVPIKSLSPPFGEQIQWNVRVHQDGTLTEASTGLQTTYLFWEAQ